MGKIVELPTISDLLGTFKEQLLELYQQALALRGSFHMALSGGSSIKPVLSMLSQMSLQWQRVHIYQVDERLVPPESAESNQRLLKEGLCVDRIPEENLHFVPYTENPAQAASEYEKSLRQYLPPEGFDSIVLGLGMDCHVASLFPEGPWLAETQRLVVAVQAENIPQPRVSLSLKALAMSRALYLLVLGPKKAQALKMLLDSNTPPETCPGKYLLEFTQCRVLVCLKQP